MAISLLWELSAILQGPAMRRGLTTGGRALAVGAALSSCVFAADLATPRGYAVGVLHVAAIPVALLSKRPRHSLLLAALATLHTVLDSVVGAAGAPLGLTLTNRGFAYKVRPEVGERACQPRALRAARLSSSGTADSPASHEPSQGERQEERAAARSPGRAAAAAPIVFVARGSAARSAAGRSCLSA